MKIISLPVEKTIIWLLLGLILILIPSYHPALANQQGPIIPPDFNLVTSAVGVQLYQKNYPGGSPDFVQIIDFSQGAIVKPLHGQVTELREGIGPYGGNDARLRSRTLQNYWQEISSTHPTAFCVTNGQFFLMLEYPTRLPFPLKKDGNLVTDGYGILDYPGQKLILEVWPGRVNIQELTPEALHASTAPDIIAGLTEIANKRAKQNAGRTFVGIDDWNADGHFEIMYIYNTRSATQVEAAEVLRSFGADKIMMLDGGGSTQLLCGNKSYISSDRLLPQALAIVAGNGTLPPSPEPAQEAGPPSEQAQVAQAPMEAAGQQTAPGAEPASDAETAPVEEPAQAAEPASQPEPQPENQNVEPQAVEEENAPESLPPAQEAPVSQPAEQLAPETAPQPDPAAAAAQTSPVESGQAGAIQNPEQPPVEERNAPPPPDPSAAAEAGISAAFVNIPGWPVLVAGEGLQLNITVVNTGLEVWRAGEYTLAIERIGWSGTESLPLERDILPGEEVLFSTTIPSFTQSGVYKTEWYLVHENQKFPETPIPFHVVVLPENMADRRQELQREVNRWTDQHIENLDDRLAQWLRGDTNTQSAETSKIMPAAQPGLSTVEEEAIDFSGVLWVPVTMLPISTFILFAINKVRRRY